MKLFSKFLCVSAVGSAAAFSCLSTSRSGACGRSSLWSSKIGNNHAATNYRNSFLQYENSRDGNSRSDSNVWTVLAHTEKWISETLASTETENGNPYSRKEVNYVCETNEDSPMIAANIFKRLREARELGQRHGISEEHHREDQGANYRPHTLRQTQVLVIPSNKDLSESFHVFDDFITAVNTARRNARDYVTDSNLEKLDQELAGEVSRDWSVSVNCAHLHPQFGKKAAEETLQQLKAKDDNQEVDLNAQEYAEKRLLARQSPYPTIVVEVRATPPPDFGRYKMPPQPTAAIEIDEDEDEPSSNNEADSYTRKELLEKKVTAVDVQKLEALFGKTAAKDHPKSGDESEVLSERKQKENLFYDAIGRSIEEVSSISHMRLAQEWVKDNDEKFSPVTSAFTESDTVEVDHAYEFVFTNLAMQKEQVKIDNIHGSRRQYLVMPRFLSSSATSLEKFTREVMNLVGTLPDLKDKVKLSTFHPEHVHQERRSPLPIICLQWTEALIP